MNQVSAEVETAGTEGRTRREEVKGWEGAGCGQGNIEQVGSPGHQAFEAARRLRRHRQQQIKQSVRQARPGRRRQLTGAAAAPLHVVVVESAVGEAGHAAADDAHGAGVAACRRSPGGAAAAAAARQHAPGSHTLDGPAREACRQPASAHAANSDKNEAAARLPTQCRPDSSTAPQPSQAGAWEQPGAH